MADTNPTTSTPTPTPAPTPEPHHRPRGYFNQAQLADLTLVEDIHRQAIKGPCKTQPATKDIDVACLDSLGTLASQARAKITGTGQASDQRHAATLHATGTERELIKQLQAIQAAAKQKHLMLEADANPATNLPLDGYLIGSRLNPNRELLIQHVDGR